MSSPALVLVPSAVDAPVSVDPDRRVRVHELQERLARRLLMCSDRVQNHQVPITHEFLATMLGTRRSTVTVAAGILQKAGVFSHTRGYVTIENRAALAEAACECYAVVHDEFLRLGRL